MTLGFVNKAFHFFGCQSTRHRQFNALRLTGPQILGRHIHHAVRIDLKADLDLRHAPRRRRDAHEFEAAQGHIVLGHFTFALKHVHTHPVLIVFGG